jgi:glycosyltransferase involved in cell wall biosynthesis
VVEVHQILAGAAFGDAITNEALELQSLLRTAVHSEIFACHPHPSVAGRIHHLRDYEHHRHARPSHVVLLVHISISEPQIFDFLMRCRERVVIRYHNITPPHFFEPYDAAFAALLERGRTELAMLADRSVKAIADSHFNETELRQHGYARTAVVPLLIRMAPLLKAHGDVSDWLDLPPQGEGPMLLFVGRLAPNKGHIHALQVFHVLRTYLQPKARLYFAGGGEIRGYLPEVRRYARDLGLHPIITGKVSDDDLAGMYRRADVFLCMSEHEGFGAPLVEAMGFDVPVVAWDTSAVGETVGDAGLLFPECDPALIAEGVNELCCNQQVRDTLVERGRVRRGRFAPERVAAELLEQLLEAV